MTARDRVRVAALITAGVLFAGLAGALIGRAADMVRGIR